MSQVFQVNRRFSQGTASEILSPTCQIKVGREAVAHPDTGFRVTLCGCGWVDAD